MYRGPVDKRVGWTSHKCLPGFCNNILTLPEAQTVCCIHFVRTLSGFSLRSPGYVFTFSSQPSAAFASNASATQDNGSSRAARAAQWGRGRGSCLWPAGAHPPTPPPTSDPGRVQYGFAPVSDKCATNCARPWRQVFDEEYGEAPTPCARGTRPSGRPPSKSFGFSNQAHYNELHHHVGSKIFGRRCPHVAVDACAKMVLSRDGNGRLR